MNLVKSVGGVVLGLLIMTNGYSQSERGQVPAAWQTTAEKTGYAKTSTYTEAVSFSKRLAAASGGLIVYKSYGKSGEGRDMPLLIAATGGASSPETREQA